MLTITFRSEDSRVQRLITEYNMARGQADEAARFQTTLDQAEDLFNSDLDWLPRKMLSLVIAACQMALAEINISTALNGGKHPETDALAQEWLGRLGV